MITPKSQQNDSGSQSSVWNYASPVVFAPILAWPPKPAGAFLALTKRWVTLTRNSLFLIAAILIYNFVQPDITGMKTLSMDWILPVYFTNVTLFLIVAGGLHLYLFCFRAQGKKFKFDPREQQEKTKKFNFNNQVLDNIFWSLVSGASIWTLYQILYYWGVANGVISTLSFGDHPVAFVLWLLILPLLLSSHFYWIHRLLHWPPLYKHVHGLHHRNVHIGPWSGMAMHPVEHAIYISSVLIHFIIPSHPIVVMYHLYARSLAPAFSHAGFEKVVVKNNELIEAADFHHQLHHRFIECNYGNVDAPWDKWFGSFHDGSDEATERVKLHRINMYRNRSTQ